MVPKKKCPAVLFGGDAFKISRYPTVLCLWSTPNRRLTSQNVQPSKQLYILSSLQISWVCRFSTEIHHTAQSSIHHPDSEKD